MNATKLLQAIQHQLVLLSKDIAVCNDNASNEPRFDSQLFASKSRKLADYFAEIEKHYLQLQQSVQQKQLAQLTFLCEKLVAQIGALQRELKTQKLREKNTPSAIRENDLYYKLAQHQNYERRLLEMLRDKENSLLQQTFLPKKQQLQQEVAVLAGRLQRCRQALMHIERKIERQEQGF